MSEAFAALFYLELRGWVNRLRTIAKDPKRLVPWIIFLAWLGVTQTGQIVFLVGGRGSPRTATIITREFAPLLLSGVPGFYLVLIGIIVGASRSAPADFSSPADARYLAGSPLSQRTVVLWLQLRKLLNPRLVLGFVMGTVILALYAVPPGTALVLQLSLFAAFMSVLGLHLPLFLARRKLTALPWNAFAWALVVAGLAAAAIGIASAAGLGGFPPSWSKATSLPPGTLVVAALAGDLRALGALLVLAAASVALTVFVAGDSYPELWEASSRRFNVMRVMRRGIFSTREARRAIREARAEPDPQRARNVVSVRGTNVPGGAWTLIWKEWIGLRRRRGGLGLQVGLLVVALVAGTVVGLAYASGPRGVSVLIGAIAFPAFIVSAYFRVSLATDLRNPLWWLSRAGLAQRLAAWAIAGMLPYFVIIGVGVSAALLVSTPIVVVPVLVAVFTLMWTMRMIGLAVYAVMPSSLDMLGPGVAIRVFAVYLLAAPVVLGGLGPGLVFHSLPVGIATATVVALVESFGLLVFATNRIEGNGLGVARAEAR